ncbi:hypothetical protein [Neobacillus sp. PS3-40]|uniref:hypothetical protein n=1 Tax=Neobacillus sp. PS3-40 TaxID=3070679 RepID=UPI0027DF17A4|nr:hypothetical protein [Neobacillus sp. PS3-40]WML44086.1 hypothetical protein RCG20_20270 [Neobacillus sp. PS3-40]
MRLTKTLYILEKILSTTPRGTDEYGRAEYENVPIYTAFQGEVEPFSNRLAETNYGLFVDCTNRLFCEPNAKIKVKSLIEYNGQEFEIIECMEYDNHSEVLMKKVT